MASTALKSSFQILCFCASTSNNFINHFSSFSFFFPHFRWLMTTILKDLRGETWCASSTHTQDNHNIVHVPWGNTHPSGTCQNLHTVKYTFIINYVSFSSFLHHHHLVSVYPTASSFQQSLLALTSALNGRTHGCSLLTTHHPSACCPSLHLSSAPTHHLLDHTSLSSCICVSNAT